LKVDLKVGLKVGLDVGLDVGLNVDWNAAHAAPCRACFSFVEKETGTVREKI
jgi:hypothetical protein